MKRIAYIILVWTTCFASAVSAGTSLAEQNVLLWPRMQADVFGCYLEETFGFKDSRFNCDMNGYVNQGDPCKKIEAYYEGPSFPENKASSIHPVIKNISLSWEHGKLQAVGFQFTRQMTREEIVKLFQLPISFEYPTEYKNVMSIDIQNCAKDSNCLLIQGFDHMGASDVDCDQVK